MSNASGTMGHLRFLFVLALVGCASIAPAPPLIVIVTRSSFEVDGVVYSSQAELKEALIRLKPKEVRVRPSPDAPYDKEGDD
jgi:hypothetical protein